MRKCILSMKEPIIATYNNYGSITSIRGDDQSSLNWIYNNFIQIGYDSVGEYLIYDIHHELFQACPYINHYTIPRVQISDSKQSLRQVIQQAIDKETYICIYINRKKLPMFFGTEDLNHEIFIYGYDEENIYFADCIPVLSTLDVNGLFAGGKYKKVSCKFEDFEQAYYAMGSQADYTQKIYFLESKKLIAYPIDIYKIIRDLESYIYSKPTEYKPEREMLYGMDGIRENIKLARSGQLKRDNALDIRGFDLLLGHKRLMRQRLIYLTKQGYLTNSEKYIKAYERLEDHYKRMKDNYLKYVFTGRKAIFNKLIERLEIELDNETEVIQEMVNYLKEECVKDGTTN